MQCPRIPRRGVTLIETVMVIVLLSAAAIASSMLLDGQWVAKRNVTGVTNEVAETLNAARNTAIMQRTPLRVRRQRRGGIEQLVITQNAGPLGGGQTRTIELGGETRLSGTPRQILFNPDGSSNRALRWIIRESRTSGEVSVAPTNGQVTRSLP